MVNRSDLIVVGKVLSQKGNVYKIEISDTFKGKVKETVKVISGPSSG